MNDIPIFEHPEKKVILWTYWQNPLDDGDGEWVDEEDASPNPFIDPGSMATAIASGDDDDDGLEQVVDSLPRPKATTFVETAAGVLPAKFNPGTMKGMEFWIGDANFYITPELAAIARSFPGVQDFTPIGPYSFRMSPGRAFIRGDGLAMEVRVGLERAFGVFRTTESCPVAAKNLSEVQEEAARTGLYWAALILPNSYVAYATSPSVKALDPIFETYKEVQRAVGGRLHRG